MEIKSSWLYQVEDSSALAMMGPWFLFSCVDSKHLKGLKKI
jgi:hypothetical protein